jgi:hypothetical protein
LRSIKEKMMRLQSKIFILLFVALGCLLFYYWSTVVDNKIQKERQIFNQSKIEGHIEFVGTKYHTTSLKLENDPHEYVFYPIADEKMNKGNVFSNIARPGDSVMKLAYGDTLTLIKSGKIYYYAFFKHLP